jgi:hypothetical protein
MRWRRLPLHQARARITIWRLSCPGEPITLSPSTHATSLALLSRTVATYLCPPYSRVLSISALCLHGLPRDPVTPRQCIIASSTDPTSQLTPPTRLPTRPSELLSA